MRERDNGGDRNRDREDREREERDRDRDRGGGSSSTVSRPGLGSNRDKPRDRQEAIDEVIESTVYICLIASRVSVY